MNCKSIVGVGALLSAITAVSSAQVSQAPPGRVVAESFFRATESRDWSAAAELLNMERFGVLFRQLRMDALIEEKVRPITVDDYVGADSTIPRPVAEREVAEINKRAFHRFDHFRREFAHVNSFAEHALLDNKIAAERWLEGHDPAYRTLLEWDLQGCKGDVPNWILPRPAERRIVGFTLGNDSIAYVIHEDARMPNADLQLLVVNRTKAGWRIDPRYIHDDGDSGVSTLCT
jgi:hypothetical protein